MQSRSCTVRTGLCTRTRATRSAPVRPVEMAVVRRACEGLQLSERYNTRVRAVRALASAWTADGIVRASAPNTKRLTAYWRALGSRMVHVRAHARQAWP
jgi:hypothetical protein